jgi:hypothetical protein
MGTFLVYFLYRIFFVTKHIVKGFMMNEEGYKVIMGKEQED